MNEDLLEANSAPGGAFETKPLFKRSPLKIITGGMYDPDALAQITAVTFSPLVLLWIARVLLNPMIFAGGEQCLFQSHQNCKFETFVKKLQLVNCIP